MNEISDLLERYYNLSYSIFTEEMADYMDHKKVNNLKQSCNDIENQIIQFSKSNDAYNTFTSIIEEKNPTAFSAMISNIDSNPNDYPTLYEAFEEFNNIHLSKVIFPDTALKNVKIKY